ncbi:hypothetical protein BCE_4745 [Bacillus cereus ATCC 10987]|uniref:Uncharacterized protein n=1 Tax=Bacillus cereus (strain ATCC 10987 / NRS 248) TaxID=222523 RepID=Q72ZC3_BACC1|nr:hypothetical protein BCE_4745 [Bacillus cereus ATCC 10987]
MCRTACKGCTCFDDSFLFGSGCSGVSFNSIATFFPSTKAKNTAPTTSNNFFIMYPLLCFISCLHCIWKRLDKLSNEMTIPLHCCNGSGGVM